MSSLIDEAIVLEDHGVRSINGTDFVIAQESDRFVRVAIRGLDLHLSPSAARRLASMLFRCARRVEERNK